MTRSKVMAIGLDGFEVTLAERLMAEGQMPAMADLRKRSARFLLDHGPALRAGLPWEHAATGLRPESAARWSPIEFDPASYTAWQDGARFAPWWSNTDLQVVVFDTPFVDLRRAPNTQGIVAWGSHDSGTDRTARPAALLADFVQRFGDYPAPEWHYGVPWPSAARSRLMGEGLCQALDVRGRATRWLATERFPEWDFFYVVPSELHSGMEGLWHGVDSGHPLNTHPSAAAAARGLLDIYRALDRFVGRVLQVAGDAVVVAFSLNGTGSNGSDIQSMVLLPELLYRHTFGHSLLSVPPAWTAAPNCPPILDEENDWQAASASWISEPVSPMRALARRLPAPVKGLLKKAWSSAGDISPSHDGPMRQELHWQPAHRYRRHWPRMRAFAIPSFKDGRIRINLRGRERDGIVEMSQYEETCQTLETLLRECRDPRTGEPAVAAIDRGANGNPLALGSSESDIFVVWRTVAAALEHPRLGLIGPVPLRRTGGHTRHGLAYIAGPGFEPGERGVRSSFDVVPTIMQLLGAEPNSRLAGKSLFSAPV